MIYIAWASFAMIAVICIGYGLFIEKRTPQRIGVFAVGGISAFIATCMDYAAVNWFGF